jgi:hypothetical protein
MKKFPLIVVVTCFLIGLMASCKNKEKQCTSLLAQVATADTTFYNAQTDANCKAFKAAMQAWLDDSYCSEKDAVKKAAFIAEIGALNCP